MLHQSVLVSPPLGCAGSGAGAGAAGAGVGAAGAGAGAGAGLLGAVAAGAEGAAAPVEVLPEVLLVVGLLLAAGLEAAF